MKYPRLASLLRRLWPVACRLRLHRLAGRICVATHWADGKCMVRGPYGQRCDGVRGSEHEHFGWMLLSPFGPAVKMSFSQGVKEPCPTRF